MKRLGSVQKLIRHEAKPEFLTIFNDVAGEFSKKLSLGWI